MRRDLNSSEIRYASNFDFPVNFVAGVYRQYETNNLEANSVKANDFGLPNGPFSSCNCDDALSNPNGNSVFGRDDDRTTTEYAGFGEATWQVTSKLALVAGVRYFTETLNGVQEQTHPFGGFPPGPTLVPVIDTTSTYRKTTFKYNASYKFNESLLLYATASEGFRGGGLNPLSEPFDPIPASFAPDTLWNYEVGAKGRLFNGRLDYQLDAYEIFWSNIQLRETTADGAFNYIGNAGDARVKGTEFEFDAHPTEHFTASLAGSYQNAYLSQGATPAQFALNPTLGLTGESIPEVPRLNFSFGLNYTEKLSDNWTGVLAADGAYRGSVNSYFTSNESNIPLKSYTLLNLRAGLLTGPWRVNLFARNVTNERAQISSSNVAGQPITLITSRPRTIGVNLTRTF
jgi:outer membrane receptor protein involved in Fe transport